MSRTLMVAVAVGMVTLLTGGAHAQAAVSASATIVEPLVAADVSWRVHAGDGAWELRAQRSSPAPGSRVLEQAWLAEPAAHGASQPFELLRADGPQRTVRPQQLLHGRSEAALLLPRLVRRSEAHRLVLTRVIAAHS